MGLLLFFLFFYKAYSGHNSDKNSHFSLTNGGIDLEQLH